ncbi:hypothetical protein PSFL_07710 [Pseudomonas sp. DD1]|uniref:hypothetical protein n=1 Tax=Pseudomonas sp. DD1 TaxID=879558 RepID=UPI0037C638AA
MTFNNGKLKPVIEYILKQEAQESLDSGDQYDAAYAIYDAEVTPASVLALIAENELLRDSPHMRAIRSLRGDCADLMAERDQLKAENELLASSRAKLAGELSRLRAKHKDWSVDAAVGKGERS